MPSWLVRSSPDLAARFSKAPETFPTRKAIFSSSVVQNTEVYKNIGIKQLCNQMVLRFCYGFPDARNGLLAGDIVLCSWARHLTLIVPLSTQVV